MLYGVGQLGAAGLSIVASWYGSVSDIHRTIAIPPCTPTHLGAGTRRSEAEMPLLYPYLAVPTSQKAVSSHATPSHHTTPHNATSCHDTPHQHNPMLRHIAPRHGMPCNALHHHAAMLSAPDHHMRRHAIPWLSRQCNATPCHAAKPNMIFHLAFHPSVSRLRLILGTGRSP